MVFRGWRYLGELDGDHDTKKRTDARVFLETRLAWAERSGTISSIGGNRAREDGRYQRSHKSPKSGNEMHVEWGDTKMGNAGWRVRKTASTMLQGLYLTGTEPHHKLTAVS